MNIHLKLDYSEGVSIKKDLLVSEKSLLELIKIIKSYNFLRKRELLLKESLRKKMAGLGLAIQNLESYFPAEDLGYLRNKETKETINRIKDMALGNETENKSIEKQIEEIRQKLRDLS